MARRVFALLTLLVVGFVLPAAGAPMRYCVINLTLLMADQPCSGCLPNADEDSDCGGCDCIVSAKILPDGLAPDGLLVPPAPAILVTALKASAARELARLPSLRGTPFERGPPSGPPLYLLQRSLLL